MKKVIYIIGFCLTLLLSSCDNWLNVKPQGQVEEENMFSDEKGFLQTLTGTYTLLNSQTAYGEELTMGFPEEIVHYWNKQSEFYQANYKDTEVVDRLNSTWKQLYKAIANVNLILKNLQGKTMADLENYDMIKGEALGLRAYLHLDLLRLFGPVLKDGLDTKAIPYHEEFSNNIVQVMTTKEVLDKIERDLLEAYKLLENDPVKVYGRTANLNLENKDLAYQFRGIRMNYYAVCGTLARFYQLKNDPVNTLKYANEILQKKDLFKLLQREDIVTAKPNLMFERELIWAIYDQRMEKKLVTSISNMKYTIDIPFRDFVYEQADAYGSAEDYREAHWWKEVKLSTSYWIPAKYNRSYDMNTGMSDEKSDNTPWQKLLPMIRLSEIYYIAAEAYLENDVAESYRLINEVRSSRNLNPLPDLIKTNKGILLNQIIYEYQKDCWGEGKLFYLYKRLFHDIITREGSIPASKSLFELPLPKDELEYGGNQ